MATLLQLRRRRLVRGQLLLQLLPRSLAAGGGAIQTPLSMLSSANLHTRYTA
jgi:hypothetical protein